MSEEVLKKLMWKYLMKYTWWHYLIGIMGLILGAEFCILSYYLYPFYDVRFTILGAFLLISAILFLFLKRELTYIMYTGMFAILSLVRTGFPIIYGEALYFGSSALFIYSLAGAVVYWLCLGYLVYKYFDFKKILAGKKSREKPSEKRYEEPRKNERDVKTEKTPYYYRVLGLSKNASTEEVKDAYRRLTKIYHPDVSADPDAEKKFKELNKAFDVLSDPDKRARYDLFEDSYNK